MHLNFDNFLHANDKFLFSKTQFVTSEMVRFLQLLSFLLDIMMFTVVKFALLKPIYITKTHMYMIICLYNNLHISNK